MTTPILPLKSCLAFITFYYRVRAILLEVSHKLVIRIRSLVCFIGALKRTGSMFFVAKQGLMLLNIFILNQSTAFV